MKKVENEGMALYSKVGMFNSKNAVDMAQNLEDLGVSLVCL